jgi:hypothetical protein
MVQLLFRLLFLVVDMTGNMIILSTHQTFTLGTLYLDNFQFIVAFNAVMIIAIFFVDFVMYSTQKFRTNLAIGEGITHHK